MGIFSEPTVLGSGGADRSADVTIPSDLAPGRYTLIMWALVDSEVQISGSVVDVLAAQPSGMLPATGGSPWQGTSLALLLVLLVLLGWALVGSTRRRRASAAVR